MSDIHDQVRDYYREAADMGPDRRNCTPSDERWGETHYSEDNKGDAPTAAAGLSMGCGNPYELAELVAGETVLDLGSGAGLDVILSAKRVGPTGLAYGLDFLDEMFEIATANAVEAGVENVKFLAGNIEDVPLPDSSVDVVISNCVINLAPDKTPVFAELARVLRPGGRIAISDVVAEDGAVVADSGDGQSWAACGTGALQRSTYIQMLEAAGLQQVTIEFTHEVGEGLQAAIIKGVSA